MVISVYLHFRFKEKHDCALLHTRSNYQELSSCDRKFTSFSGDTSEIYLVFERYFGNLFLVWQSFRQLFNIFVNVLVLILAMNKHCRKYTRDGIKHFRIDYLLCHILSCCNMTRIDFHFQFNFYNSL